MSFRQALLVCDPSLQSEQLEALEFHYTLLQKWNKVLNLTAIRDPEEMVQRHYCESLFLARYVSIAPGELVVDVGSGAGFPGVPFAVAHPEAKVLLVESHARKAVFLSEATRKVTNVEVRNSRFESVHDAVDLLISRAVSWADLKAGPLERCKRVALLLGSRDVQSVTSDNSFSWGPPISTGENRWLLQGST